VAPRNLPGERTAQSLWYAEAGLPNVDPVQVLFSFAILLVSLSVHEAAHAWSADRLGDKTARMLGRVSLNPIVHADPIGTILFPLLAMFSPVPLIGWAKPVPVNVRNLGPDWRRKYVLIAAAGPASNLVLAVLAAILLRIVSGGSPLEAAAGLVSRILFNLITLNILLAVFNLVPVPPLDGGNVLAGLLQGPVADAFDKLRPYGFIILYALMLTGILWTIIDPIAYAIRSLLI
jgi:Zn-dependent protease